MVLEIKKIIPGSPLRTAATPPRLSTIFKESRPEQDAQERLRVTTKNHEPVSGAPALDITAATSEMILEPVNEGEQRRLAISTPICGLSSLSETVDRSMEVHAAEATKEEPHPRVKQEEPERDDRSTLANVTATVGNAITAIVISNSEEDEASVSRKRVKREHDIELSMQRQMTQSDTQPRRSSSIQQRARRRRERPSSCYS